MEDRIKTYTKTHPWLVLENELGEVAGYAYAAKWQPRSAYKQTCEITVYLDKDQSGYGYGSALYKALLPLLKTSGFHTVVAGIALPNEASVKLQESFGFKKVTHFQQVGRKFDRWIDVGHWQLLLNDISFEQ
ncbi:hypothetical protein TYM08_P0198 [Marinicellulosiphila megalodicopiae]